VENMTVGEILTLIEVSARSLCWIMIAVTFWLQSSELKTLKVEVQNLTRLLCSILSNVNKK
jgi:hypothetical protein